MLVCMIYTVVRVGGGMHLTVSFLAGSLKKEMQFSHERKIHWSIWKGKISQGLTPPRSCSDIRRHSQGWP